MILNQKVTDGGIDNQKRKTFFQDGQLETTFNSISRSDSNKEFIIEQSQHQDSRNHLAFDFFEDSDENDSEEEIRKDSILYDENYSPYKRIRKAKSSKIKPSPIKLRQRKQKTKSLKKTKKIKKAQTKNKKNTSKSLQSEDLINSDEKLSNLTQQNESKNKAQNKNIYTQKNVSSYGVQTINSVDSQESIDSKKFFILKIQEKTPQIISLEIRTKLMQSYKELLNEKMQNDREYQKQFKILIKENTKLLRQNKFYKAKLQQTEHPVKIETNLTQDQSIQLIEQIQPMPIEMEHLPQMNPSKKLETPQIKQFFIEKPIKPIKIQQNQKKKKQFQSQLNQIIPTQIRQQSFIGDLSSFGSSKDSAQDNYQYKNQFLPSNQQSMILKLKETEKQILKDTEKKFNQQDFDYWLGERNQQRGFMNDKDAEPQRQTIFNRRRRNQKLGSSNSSSASERSQDKNTKIFIQTTEWSKKWNEKLSNSQNKIKAKKHRQLMPNFQTVDIRSKKKQLKQRKQARKLERGNSRFSKEEKRSKNKKWSKNNEKSQRSPRFSSDEKQIDY